MCDVTMNAVNQTAETQLVRDINFILEPSATTNIEESATLDEIYCSHDLVELIEDDKILLSDGIVTFDKAQSLRYITPFNEFTMLESVRNSSKYLEVFSTTSEDLIPATATKLSFPTSSTLDSNYLKLSDSTFEVKVAGLYKINATINGDGAVSNTGISKITINVNDVAVNVGGYISGEGESTVSFNTLATLSVDDVLSVSAIKLSGSGGVDTIANSCNLIVEFIR